MNNFVKRAILVSMVLLFALCIIGAASTTIYISNMDCDTTLAGANKGLNRIVEPHNVAAWAKRQASTPFIIDAGNYMAHIESGGEQEQLASSPWLSLSLLKDDLLGRLDSNRKLVKSGSVSVRIGAIPFTFLSFRSIEDSINHTFEVSHVTVAFTKLSESDARRILTQVNSGASSNLDILIRTDATLKEVRYTAVEKAVLIALPAPSPVLLRLEISDAPFKVSISQLDNAYLQTQRT